MLYPPGLPIQLQDPLPPEQAAPPPLDLVVPTEDHDLEPSTYDVPVGMRRDTVSRVRKRPAVFGLISDDTTYDPDRLRNHGLGYTALEQRNYIARALLAKRSGSDPRNHAAAMLDDKDGWTDAEGKELRNHESNASFTKMRRRDLPSNIQHRRLTNLTWVFKTKRDGRRKARLCVQGCTQVRGRDYDQTFCAAMRPTSLRVLTALAAAKGFKMRRWDFVAAYLQGDLEPGEENYCSCPPGYEETDDLGDAYVYRVKKPVYGMAQAGRRWQRSLFPFLIGLGYTQFGSDPCLFRKTDIIDGIEHTVLVGVYVDDLAIVYSHDGPTSLYGIFSAALTQRWEVEDEGPITDLLNIEFDTSVPGSITIHQQSFINGLVELHGTKLSARLSPEHTVLPFDGHLAQHVIDAVDARDAEAPAVSATELRDYQSIVGAMLYCSTNTRPDIAYPISMLCRCMSCPTYAIIGAAQHVLRYLERTDRLGLTYSYSPDIMMGYADAVHSDASSTVGWNFQYSQAAVSWGSKKAKTISRSSLDSSIMATSEAAKEAAYLTNLINEIGFPLDSPMKLYISDTSVTERFYEPPHDKSRHIERRHGWLHELADSARVEFPFISAPANMAAFFSGGIRRKQSFIYARNRIMNIGSRIPDTRNGGVSQPH